MKNNINDSFPHVILDQNDEPHFSIAFCKQQVEDLIDAGFKVFDVDYREEFKMNTGLVFDVFIVCHSMECKNMVADETWSGFYSKPL